MFGRLLQRRLRDAVLCTNVQASLSFPCRQGGEHGRAMCKEARLGDDDTCAQKDSANSERSPVGTLESFQQEHIRNFSIIAHIDHGKSTLADRLLETGRTGRVKQAQFLDKLRVERERGITVKANSASIVYRQAGTDYLLNLIDTPGHVDFSYEVSRSLAACQGAVLLVDGAQGIQAQTVANFYLAWEQGLTIVPVINKVDMPAADPERVAEEMANAFDIDPDECILTSAKTGLGVQDVLNAIIERIPPPAGDPSGKLRLLLFDAFHDEYRGVICMVLVKDGCVKKGDKVKPFSDSQVYDVLEVGKMAPEMTSTEQLSTGEVGYMITGLKSTRSARVGDTWHHPKEAVEALPGFKPAKAMMFADDINSAGIFPVSNEDFDDLGDAIDKLTLNDASVSVKKETSSALGAGFRCGFLGMLHMDVFMQRLDQEHDAQVLTTTPTVPFRLKLPSAPDDWVELDSPLLYPKEIKPLQVQEPTVNATIIFPEEFTGKVLELCASRRGELLEHSYLQSRCLMRYQLPLSELAGTFYNTLKSLTSGYATFDYEEGPFRDADLVRLDFLIHGSPVDALTRVVHRSNALAVGREVCEKIRDVVDRQPFEIAIQAVVGSKVLARETVRATRKDVLAKCYGGDITRKKKLLEKQKEGKAKMKNLGAVSVAPEAFYDLMRHR